MNAGDSVRKPSLSLSMSKTAAFSAKAAKQAQIQSPKWVHKIKGPPSAAPDHWATPLLVQASRVGDLLATAEHCRTQSVVKIHTYLLAKILWRPDSFATLRQAKPNQLISHFNLRSPRKPSQCGAQLASTMDERVASVLKRHQPELHRLTSIQLPKDGFQENGHEQHHDSRFGPHNRIG